MKKTNKKTTLPPAAKSIAPARVAAYHILLKIEKERSFASALLPVFEAEMEPRDRGLCHELTLGVLRHQMFLDRLIDVFTNSRKIDIEVRIILRLALYQLRFLDRIPAHAAINDAVSLVKKAKKMSAKGFVNAILRKSTREVPELVFADDLERLSVETSHPRWLLERWSNVFGPEQTAALAKSNNDAAELEYRFTGKTSDADRDSLTQIEVSPDLSYLRELASDGKIYFQDKGSRLVGDAVKLNPGDRFLDLCAAPGSKTTQIAAKYSDQNCRFTAGDLYAGRTRLLRANCLSQNVGFVDVVQYDVLNEMPFADESFDAILVDAPCSGTGTLRHNPEIRYFLSESDIKELASKQLAILKKASKLVKRGGRLIYSTCSLEREENEKVTFLFLDEVSGFDVVRPNVGEDLLTPEGFARTMPGRDAADGFFIAVFEKM